MDYFLNIANAGNFGGGTLVAMFVAGLIGGLSHCTGMCSPFSIALATRNYQKIEPSKLNEWNRAKASLVLPYHAGRISTYAFLGGVSAYISSMVSHQDWFGYARMAMIVVACLFFISAALSSGYLNKFIKLPYSTEFFTKLSKKYFGRTDFSSTYTLGVLLGFIPCGLVYGALMVAASTAKPLFAAGAVAAFGLGTVLPLFAATYGAGFFLKRFRNHFKKIAPAMMGLNSVLIFIMIIKLY